jgi:hypothetical protein
VKEKIEEESEEADENQELKKETIEKEFYNEFNYNFGQEMDPFLALGKNQADQRMSMEDSNMSGDFEMFF